MRYSSSLLFSSIYCGRCDVFWLWQAEVWVFEIEEWCAWCWCWIHFFKECLTCWISSTQSVWRYMSERGRFTFALCYGVCSERLIDATTRSHLLKSYKREHSFSFPTLFSWLWVSLRHSSVIQVIKEKVLVLKSKCRRHVMYFVIHT